jgi:hypothetical protein
MGTPQNDPIGGRLTPASDVVTPAPVEGDEKAAIMAELDAGKNSGKDSELDSLRAELAEFRAEQARRERQGNRPQRGDTDGVSAPLEAGEERENTHTLYLANGKSVETAGVATHYGTEDGVFPVTYAHELPRR